MGSAVPLAAATLLTLVALVVVVLSGVAAATAPSPPQPVTHAVAPDWAAEVQRLRTMPCAAGNGSGVLYAFVGADPTWTAALQEAVAEHGARCSN